MRDRTFSAAVRAIDIGTLLSCRGDIGLSLEGVSEETVAAAAYHNLEGRSCSVDCLKSYLQMCGCTMSDQRLDALILQYSSRSNVEGLWDIDASEQLVWRDVLGAC